MTIYFVQAETGGPIKIGYTSKSLHLKIASLRYACPYPLTVLATCEGDVPAERGLHRRFKDQRIHGEWFSPADELLNFIRVLPRDANYADCWGHESAGFILAEQRQ